MIRTVVFSAAGAGMLLVGAAAHSQSYGQSYGQQPAATTPAMAPSDTKADSKKAKSDDDTSDTQTVIRAGPNAGQVINRHHRSKDTSKNSDTSTTEPKSL